MTETSYYVTCTTNLLAETLAQLCLTLILSSYVLFMFLYVLLSVHVNHAAHANLINKRK